jgi:hypothetical protein
MHPISSLKEEAKKRIDLLNPSTARSAQLTSAEPIQHFGLKALCRRHRLDDPRGVLHAKGQSRHFTVPGPL